MDGRHITILIAEDHDSNRKLLALLLEQEGYDVRLATDGLEALEEMKKTAFDAVITDRDMPRMNGVEFLVLSRAIWPETPVILVSAHANDRKETGRLRGAFAWLQKPYEFHQLLEVLQAAIDTSPHRDWAQSSTTTLSS